MSIGKMACPGGGLYVVEGEVSLLMTAMRRGARWSSHSHQDEDQDTLMKGLASLKEALNDADNLAQLEPGVFLAPFLEVIRSEETTGPVTSLALSAVNKIISYGLIDPDHGAVASCVESVADAVTHARFVGTDASGDGVVLMRILQVLRGLMLAPAGNFLSNESVCEIMLSCFRICFETRLSELLRRTAEHCLRDMVQHLFTRLPQFVDDTRVLLNMKKMRTNGMENTRTKNRKNKTYAKQKSKLTPDDDESETQLLSPVERVRAGHLATTPVTPSSNIVDMQGSLDRGTPDRADEEKNENKDNSSKTEEPDKSQIITEAKEQDKANDPTKNEESGKVENKESLETGKRLPNDAVIHSEDKIEKPTELEHKLSSPQNQSDTEVNSIEEENKTLNLVQSPTGSIEDLSVDDNGNTNREAGLPKIKVEADPPEEYVNTQGVRFTPLQQLAPYGSLCVRELFRFLVSLCSPLDKQNTEVMMHLGLSLLQVALEVSADALANFPSLLSLVKDDLCRNLILLLGSDRLSILAADLQVSFLLFESLREYLKFQMEYYFMKLMELVNSDSNRITYEQRELALEAIVRLWRIPGLPAELYLNFDCGLYSTNLYEDLTKLLSKNASALSAGIHSMQLISLDALIMLIEGIESRCKGVEEQRKAPRHPPSHNLPNREELLATKANKRWLVLGTEQFNEKPRSGINILSERGLLGGTPGHPDPQMIAKLLRENPGLDKKEIGEYISRRDNRAVLECFVKSFDLRQTRVDQALRLYLESFRLPGEAPLISLLLEHFAEHWHTSNGEPFASADAAFTLAYAVIMLNVDQHNYNVKRQNNPMTPEEFKKNLKKVNGGADFDQDMLDEMYTAIKNEEIVMPAEQTGLVRENYLWKVLLRRGAGPESNYLRVGRGGELVDRDLAIHAWAPVVTALCRAYDKAPDRPLQRRVARAFLRCASISAHYGMSSDLDTLVVSLCKFTGLATGGELEQLVLQLGGSGRSQLAARTLFEVTHRHGDALRASWRNVVDCLQAVYRARLLPRILTEGEDFLDVSGKVSLIREPATPRAPPAEQSILSSLYSYIALDAPRVPHPAEATARRRATQCVTDCRLELIIAESKFLQVESLRSLVGALVAANPQDEDLSVFLLELLLKVTIQNRDRVMCIWPIVQAHIEGLLTTAARENHAYLLERVAVGMLRLAIRLLRGEELAGAVLPPLTPLTHLPSATTATLARQLAYGLFELLKTGAANIHTTEDWKVVFSLLECAGAGALAPKHSNTVLDDVPSRTSVLDPRPVSPVPEWVLVSPTGTEAPLPVTADIIILDRDLHDHDPAALVKCCESLAFLVRDVAHVTPFNFELCVRCVRTFAEAVLIGAGKRHRAQSTQEEPAGYQQTPIQLLDLMHTLHTRTAQVFRWWAEEGGAAEGVSLWPQGWRPLLQGIARLCCDARRSVRTSAVTYLQRALLAHDLAQLAAAEWSQCLEHVLFPLLAQLLGPIAPNDPIGVEETRVRAATLLSKVFLHHLTPLLTLPGFLPIWLTVLDLLKAYMHADNSELLFEAIPESLKNMLLVMASAGVLASSSNLWLPTWRAIDTFLPNLKIELFPEPAPQPPQHSKPQVVTLVGHQQPSFPSPIAPQPEMSSPTHSPPQSEPIREIPVTDAQVAPASPITIKSNSATTMPIPVSVQSLALENKEPQQVITLVNQPAPSVASPVAVQPMAQQVFELPRGLNQETKFEDEEQPQVDFEQQSHQKIHQHPTTDIEQPYPAPQPAEFDNDKSLGENDQHKLVKQQNEAQIFVVQPPQPQHQYLHLHQQQAHQQQLQYPGVASPVHQVHLSSSPVMTTEGTSSATVFNSAAYFSEDPAADRLFAVTTP
ncbi:Golgi-specific brefeldin A-resistance guanine nucleotide exchange factor 1 isoform X2 [Athalia rosae]|uniref:Golgi-specific brefeldin A-resistance guanine nucleotide exchange factor 1 isoform X2 n=1 Tax=Athalia rosae TaxID=37344 RepID=UPI002033B77F|nr:Golgi-specific brefeldin A-resistance guanine nucleotide exchange factor 1 isoform X2 [Athalia rosae]